MIAIKFDSPFLYSLNSSRNKVYVVNSPKVYK